MQLQQRTRSHEKMPQLQVRQAREALRGHRVWMQRTLRSRGWRAGDTRPRDAPLDSQSTLTQDISAEPKDGGMMMNMKMAGAPNQ